VRRCCLRTLTRDQGSGVLLAMIVMGTMLALGLGLVAVSSTERAIAGNHQAGVEALYAAEALAEYVLTELASDASWSPALTGERHSAFLDPTSQPTTPWNEALDLSAITTRIQQQSDATWSAGLDTPQWRVFAAGPLETLVGSGNIGSMFLIAWVADDVADADADPGADNNGLVMIRAQAVGPAGLQRALLIVFRRDEGGGCRVGAWREVR
jgi:hypothetical protein